MNCDKKFTNFTKKIFIFFLIFNLTFVSTAQAAGVFVDSFDVSDEDTVPSSVVFNNDGTKMFVLGKTGEDVNEYTLSTAFDVSTASFVDSFDIRMSSNYSLMSQIPDYGANIEFARTF